MLPPCHFLLYSSNTIVTLTEETNRSSHSDTKKLDHFTICNIIISATNGNKRCNLFLRQNVANLGFWRIVPKIDFRTKKAFVRGLAGGAFMGRRYTASLFYPLTIPPMVK